MKTITIPANVMNPYVVDINGMKYSYAAGSTVSVPDEVAEAITNALRLSPRENPPAAGSVLTFGGNSGTWAAPDTAPAEGSAASVTSGGVWQAIEDAKVTDEQLKEAAEEVLEDHPEWTTTVEDGAITTAKLATGVIDDTLAVSGSAAEAKVTGDAISKINASVFDQKTVYPEATKYFGASATYLNIIAGSDNFTFEAGRKYYLTVKCIGLEGATIGDMTSYGFRTYKYEGGSYTLVENLNTLFASGITALRSFVHGGEEKTVVYTPQASSNIFRLTLANSTGGTDRGVTCTVAKEIDAIEEQGIETNARIDSALPKKGKVICNMGDSIFGRITSETDNRTISELIAEQTEAEVHNFAFPGSIVDTSYEAYGRKAVMFVSLAHAIATGDFTDLDSYAVSYPDYAERIADIKATDYTKVDIITVAYGTNDWDLECSLNRYSDGIKSGIKEIQQVYPNIRFILVTPIIRFKTIDGELVSSYDERMVNDAVPPIMLGAFVDRMLETAPAIDCMAVDNYHNTGITLENQQIFLADKVHPTILGRKILANRIAKAIAEY